MVDVAEMRAAVEALVGMPLDPTDRLAALSTDLRDRALLEPAATDALLVPTRCGAARPRLELREARCDVLLYGAAASAAEPLAESLGDATSMAGRAR